MAIKLFPLKKPNINFRALLWWRKNREQEYTPSFKDRFLVVLDNIKETYNVFSREKVFRYLSYIVVLMVIFSLLLTIFEYQKIKSALPEGGEGAGWLKVFITAIYWAWITLSTVGYGDISPGTYVGRILVVISIYAGMSAIALFTANLASVLTAKRIKEGFGVRELAQMKGHFVICGWKKDMEMVLQGIMTVNPTIRAEDIVILANVDTDTVERFKSHPQMAEITVIRGEHFNENNLQKANVSAAKNILILADESTNASMSEIDSKTVITAMTLSRMIKKVHVTAEILDPKYEEYLAKTHVVDELIYSSEYSRTLIANAAGATGIASVINNLLDIATEVGLQTRDIPDEFIGKPVCELRNHFLNNNQGVLIGTIENVGNYFERKREALRDAQKTAKISELIENLNKVKTLENNVPFLSPPEDYAIPRNALAVLIERRG